MKKALVVFVCVVFAALICGAVAAKDLDEIRIGVVAPISGNNALTGKYMSNAVQLVINKVEAAGGVTLKDGRTLPVKFIFEDNENKADITTNAFNKLIEEEDVLAIMGPDSSTCALAGDPVAQDAGVVAMTTFGTNTKVTQVGDYIFRACFIDPFQGQVMAKYAYDILGVRKVAIIFNNANDFSLGLTQSFTENFEKFGGEILTTQSYSGSDVKDFNAQMTNIKATDPEALFMPGMLAELPLMLQQARNVGITCPILSGDAADTPELAVMAGKEYVEGLTYTSAFSSESTVPAAVEFVNAYKEAYGEVPNSNAVLAYEAAELLLEAVRTADKVDRKGIRDALAAIQDFEVPSGTISFDENRNPIKGAVVLQFQDGVSKFITSVNP